MPSTIQRFSGAALMVLTTLYLTGCHVGSNMGEVFRHAKGFGLVAILILVIDVYLLMNVIESNRSLMNKVLWGLVIWFMPVLGAALYYFFAYEKKVG